ncbi:MAG: hypothetical protein V7785_01470 [Bermanella sp.]
MKHRVMMLIGLLFSLLASGCVVITGSSNDDDELQERVFDESSKDIEIDSSSKYNLSLTGSSNKVTLLGDVEEMFITGSYNYVLIKEDTYLESLIITGLHNIVVQEDDLQTVIGDIEIAGDNNFIEVSQYYALIDVGSGNQVLMTDSGLVDEN